MAKAVPDPGHVILFTHEGFSYESLRSLGTGPHGEDLVLARKRTAENILERVLLKCVALPPGEPSVDTQRTRARLEEEVRLATYLHHRCLVRVLGQQQTPEALYTLLEYVRGPTLDELVTLSLERGKPFSEAFTLYLGAELASALDHVHTREDEHGHRLGIVHRNLSTETIRLTGAGEVKLADFSLARSELPGRRASTLRKPRGPLFFSAPETILAGRADARSDLFALGLVLLEFATGRHLFDPAHKTYTELRSALAGAERRRVQRLVREALAAGHGDMAQQAIWGAATFTRTDVEQATASLSAPLKATLERLLRRNPEERFQEAQELEDTLREQLERLGAYAGSSAVAEIRQALAEAGQVLVSHELAPGLLAAGLVRSGSPQQPSTR